MRKITLPDARFGIQTQDGIQAISAAEQLHLIVVSPPRPGDVFTIDQIRARLPLVEKLAALGDKTEFLVEDHEYRELLVAVEASTWSGVSSAAVALVDAVKDAKVVDVDDLVEAEN